MIDDLLDGVVFVFLVLLVVVVSVGGMVYLLAEFVIQPSCYAMTAEMGFDSKWSFFGDCQINVGGKWIPLSNYRYFEE